MYYLIDTSSNLVIASMTSIENYTVQPGFIIREADLGTDIERIIYDPETDTLRLMTDEEYLNYVKDVKLSELKATITSEFSEFGDILADIVKVLKLMLKTYYTDDPDIKSDIDLFLKAELEKLETLYPDDYSKLCVDNYLSALLDKLPKYYQAKMTVLNATTVEEVESVNLVFD